VSKIDTERLLIQMIEIRLKDKKANYEYNGKFTPLSHFLGYEGRCAAPSNFDANYCYSLGYNTVGLIQSGLSGYISTVKNLTAPAQEWIPGGVPITNLMHFENRNGKKKPVIEKALVKTDGPVFKEFEKQRDKWAIEDDYVFPGAIQYWGPSKLCDVPTLTLGLEKN
jgi:pyrophosphate--fructose-6-phosphate 1-phosphotransferase